MTVLAANAWSTNAHLIEDVVRLGYIQPDDVVLDPTNANGVWWKRWRPEQLVIPPSGTDFRQLPYRTSTFDVAAFDPPYVTIGGRETSGIKDFLLRYGLNEVPKTPRLTQALINDGLTEMCRVVKPGGIVLCKCADYIWSGKLWPGVFLTQKHATETIGCHVEDVMVHTRSTGGPQPGGRTRRCARCKGRGEVWAKGGAVPCPPPCKQGRIATTQQHARRNLSTLLVLRVPK